MGKQLRIIVSFLALAIITPCTTSLPEPNDQINLSHLASTQTPTPTAASTQTPTDTPIPSATEVVPESSVREITVLYTNDEQCWMEGVEEGSGAANLIGVWQKEHGYTPDGPFVILSGGDMWTGAAISTLYEGQSMVEVMNSMHYDAAALGNHEFDFGLEDYHNALRKWISHSLPRIFITG